MSKQRTKKMVIKVLILISLVTYFTYRTKNIKNKWKHPGLQKTYSSFEKKIQTENNFMQNTCNKWMNSRNVRPKHENATMGSSAIHLHNMKFQNMTLYDTIIRLIIKVLLYRAQLSVSLLTSHFTEHNYRPHC